MIIAVVEIPRSGPDPDRDTRIQRALESTEIYRDVKGLLRKDYLNGENCGGGVYTFDTRENADAWFHDGWEEWIESRFGTRPTVRLYDLVLTLDNEAKEVRVEGQHYASTKPDAAE